MSAPSPALSTSTPPPTDTTQPQSADPVPPIATAETSNSAPEKASADGEPFSTTPVSTPRPDKNEQGEHLLETPWTLWFDHKIPKSATSAQTYAEHLNKLGTFSTVEGFYRMYVNLVRPADLPKDSNYHLFRNDAAPMWESFPNGGCWILKVKRKEPEMHLGLLWEQLLFASIGEIFEEPKIVGVVLSTRSKADVLAVWSSDGQNHHIITRVSDKLRIILNLDRSIPIEYKPHMTSMKDKSTYRNGKLVVPKDKKKKKRKGKHSGDKKEANNASATQEKEGDAKTDNEGNTSDEVKA